MEGSSDVVFPTDVQDRMRVALVEDIDSRLKDVTGLVALQEGELALLWIVILGLVCYVVRKDYRER